MYYKITKIDYGTFSDHFRLFLEPTKGHHVQYIQDLRVTEWLLFNTDVGYSNLMSLLEDLSVLYKIPFEYVQEDFISVILKEL